MKVGICCAGVGQAASGDFVRRSAQAAEKAGFTAFWVGEHVLLFGAYPESKYPYAGGDYADGGDVPVINPRDPIVDPVVTLTWAAATTSTIEVGSGILILPQRNPVVLAKELSTLDAYCGGRVVLGAGIGWCKEEYDAIGADWGGRGKRMDEHVAALRTLWRDDISHFAGETVSFADAYLYPKPVRDIPILIGGESDAALKRVARAGDGWLAFSLPVEQAAARIAKLKELTRAQGRDPEKLRIITAVFSHTGEDDLKRYREAGITEFNLVTAGELPIDETGLAAGMADFAQRFVATVADW